MSGKCNCLFENHRWISLTMFSFIGDLKTCTLVLILRPPVQVVHVYLIADFSFYKSRKWYFSRIPQQFQYFHETSGVSDIVEINSWCANFAEIKMQHLGNHDNMCILLEELWARQIVMHLTVSGMSPQCKPKCGLKDPFNSITTTNSHYYVNHYGK